MNKKTFWETHVPQKTKTYVSWGIMAGFVYAVVALMSAFQNPAAIIDLSLIHICFQKPMSVKLLIRKNTPTAAAAMTAMRMIIFVSFRRFFRREGLKYIKVPRISYNIIIPFYYIRLLPGRQKMCIRDRSYAAYLPHEIKV